MDAVSIFRSGVVRSRDETLATVPVPLCPTGNDYIEFMDVLLNWPLLFPSSQELDSILRHVQNQTGIMNQSRHQIGSIELGQDTCFEREDRARLLLHLLFVHQVNLPPYDRLPTCLQLLLRCLDKNQFAKWRNVPAVCVQFHCLASRDMCLPDRLQSPPSVGKRSLSAPMSYGLLCVSSISSCFISNLTRCRLTLVICRVRTCAMPWFIATATYSPRAESVIEHFVCELGGYLYQIDDDWKRHTELKQATTRTIFRWCQAQLVDATSATVRLIRQLSLAAARKISNPVHVVHGAYTYQFQHTAVQLWESSLKRPSCMFLASEEAWRASQLRMIFFYAQVARQPDESMYWFAPHVRGAQEWHVWRCFVLGRDLLTEPDPTPESEQAHALLRRFFEKRPFNRLLLPLYLQILSYDDVEWDNVRTELATHCGRTMAGLIDQCGGAPDKILYYPRTNVTEDGFMAMMEIEWYARRVHNETYDVDRRGYTYKHLQLDSPLICTSEQEWIGLNHKTRACLPLDIHESYYFSGTFDQSRQVRESSKYRLFRLSRENKQS